VEHEPVLPDEVLGYLAEADPGVLLDATVGLGGHSARFLERFSEGAVIGIDRDEEALASAKQRLAAYGDRVQLFHAAFADLADVVADAGVGRVQGALFDLGVSSPQLDRPERGFSFRADGPLDMRMDPTGGETAAEYLRRVREKELADLLFHRGGERASRRIAKAIVAARRRRPILTTGELAEIVRAAAPGRRGRIDPATRTFQALRIAVNDESGQLERGLDAAGDVLAPGGVLVAISFHSGEDGLVKRFLRADARFQVLTKKPVRPGAGETRRNPRARPARLRAARRTDVERRAA